MRNEEHGMKSQPAGPLSIPCAHASFKKNGCLATANRRAKRLYLTNSAGAALPLQLVAVCGRVGLARFAGIVQFAPLAHAFFGIGRNG